MRKILEIDDLIWIAEVNGNPYFFTEERVTAESIPHGYLKYEVADAEGEGRFCRISKQILVNFIGTIIGRDTLPLDENGQYYCRWDEKYDQDRDNFIEKIEDNPDEEYERLLILYDEHHFPEDPDGYMCGIEEFFDDATWDDFDISAEEFDKVLDRYPEKSWPEICIMPRLSYENIEADVVCG